MLTFAACALEQSGISTNPSSAFFPPSSPTDNCRKVGSIVIVWCYKCNRWNSSNSSNTNCQRPHTDKFHNAFYNGPKFSNMPRNSTIQKIVNVARRDEGATQTLNSNVVHAKRRENYTKKKEMGKSRSITLFETYPKYNITTDGKTDTSRHNTNNNNIRRKNNKSRKEKEEDDVIMLEEEDDVIMLDEEEMEEEEEEDIDLSVEEDDDVSSSDDDGEEDEDDDKDGNDDDDVEEVLSIYDDNEDEEEDTSIEVVHPTSDSLKDVTNNTAVNEKKRKRSASTGNTRTSSTRTNDTHTGTRRSSRQPKPTDKMGDYANPSDTHAAFHARVG